MAYNENTPADSLTIADIPSAIRQKGADLKTILDALTGSSIANTPYGNIIATTIQAAVNELEDKKAIKNHASTGTTFGLGSASNYGHTKATSATPAVASTADIGTDNGLYARGDHVHPAQTTITGNAATATKLAAPIKINGKNMDGSSDINIDNGTFTEGKQALGTINTATTINCANGSVATATLGAAATISLTANASTTVCRSLTLILTNGGAYTITWNSSIKWPGGTAPTLSAAGVDILTFVTVDNGATWYAGVNGVGFA